MENNCFGNDQATNHKTQPWERIEMIMEYYSLNKNTFSKEIRMSNNVTIGRIINEHRKPSTATLNRIVKRFPEIDYDWLLTGKGQMLCTSGKDPFGQDYDIQVVDKVNIDEFIEKIRAQENPIKVRYNHNGEAAGITLAGEYSTRNVFVSDLFDIIQQKDEQINKILDQNRQLLEQVNTLLRITEEQTGNKR